MGLLAFLVDIVLQRLNSFKYTAVKTVVSHHGGFWAPYMVWLVFTMGYSALSAFLVTSFAPLGAGSGIPEIKTYLNGVHIKGTDRQWLACIYHRVPDSCCECLTSVMDGRDVAWSSVTVCGKRDLYS